MLKLIKYEYRRNISGILVMLGLILAAQGYFLWGVAKMSMEHVTVAASLLMTLTGVAVSVVLLYSVSLYSKELNAKTSYLTFMTPNSSAKILGAKLLATLLLGLAYAALLGGCLVWDFTTMRRLFPEIQFVQAMLDALLIQANTNLSELLVVISSFAVDFLVNFYATVVIAYLAITISATALQNKRFKGLLSLILFLGIMAAMIYLLNLLPRGYYSTMEEMMLNTLPGTLVSLAFAVAAFLLSARLLTKRVSL